MAVAKDYAAITSIDQLRRLADQMVTDGKPIGFDIETGYHGPDFKKRALDHYNPDQLIVGFSFSNDESWARYVPVRHNNGGNIDAEPEAVWDAVRDMLERGHIISFQEKFERAGMRKVGIELGKYGKVSDPMLAAYVLGKYYALNWRTIVDLKGLVKEIYDHDMAQIHSLWPDLAKNKEQFIRFNTLEVTPEVVSYACEDAAWVIPLYRDLCLEAEKENPFMYTLEHKISRMMEEVERYGVTVNWHGMEEEYARAQLFVPQMEYFVKQGLGELAGRDLTDMNLNSAPQKQKLLFEEIGFTTTRTSQKTGKMSADKKSLEGLAKEYPAVRNLLQYGEVKNHMNRMKKWLNENTHAIDGKAHARYNQVTVPGGRFAANDPAIQQCPKEEFWAADGTQFDLEKDKEAVDAYMAERENGKDYWYYNFRDFIVAAEDHYLVTFDFSQAELRMLAGLTQEPTLLNAFANDDDIHAATAAIVFGVPLDKVTKEQRAKGKTTNFAIIYGQGPKATAEQLGISMDEAIELNKQYFAALPFVTQWYNEVKRRGFREGAIRGVFGRRVPIWELLSPSKATQAKGERVIVNSYCQGGVADYVKFIQLQARKVLIDEGLWGNGVMMTMNQHDALTFECHNSVDPNRVRELLQPAVVLNPDEFPPLKGFPPFVADWELGQQWGSSDKWGLNQPAVFDGEHWVVAPENELSHFTLSVRYAPTESEFKELVGQLKSEPGDTLCRFICPEVDIEFPFTAKVTESKAKQLKKIFKDAKIEVQ